MRNEIMFKDFKYQKSMEYATFRLLSSDNNIDQYRTKYDILKNYSSGIVFPEQMIGYSGTIYIIGQSDSTNCQSFHVTKKSVSGAWCASYKIKSDAELIALENQGYQILINQEGGYAGYHIANTDEFAFLNKKHASKFAQNLLDKKIKGL